MKRSDFFPFTRAKPFKPYRIYLENGTVYQIDWPDMVMPLASHALVVVPTPHRPERDEEIVRVPLDSIHRIESLPENASTTLLTKTHN